MRIYGGSDYAVTADGGDYTVHLVVGLDPEGRMYLLDRWRKQSSSDEWIESFPAGKHDDQIDALGLIGQLLDQMVPGQKPRQPDKPKVDSGYRPIGLDEQPLDWLVF